MNLKDIAYLLSSVIDKYLNNKKFTGKIIFTIHCREGKAAKCVSDIQENYANRFVENNGCVADKNR
jgi:hypothetical protein